MVKLSNNSSKLSNLSQEQPAKQEINTIGIVRKNKYLIKTKSFRFSDDDLKTLEFIRNLVNQESKTYINDSQIIKALVQLGSKIEAKKILKAIAETL